MSTDLLFQHFATLAAAPNGIAKLRQLILQFAVKGKLGTQDERDEPANVLVERIKEEKKQLAKKGKIKRENLPKSIQEIESLYSVPKGWEWVTLSDIFLDIRSGGTPSKNNPKFWDGDINWASVKDLKNGKYLESTQDKITQQGLDECRSKLIPPDNLIICVRMGLGKIAINKIPLAINQDLKAANLSKNVDINYFYYFYKAQTVQGTGMTVEGIRQEKLLQMPFPLPPLAEQYRIVAKVDRLMLLCDELEARQQQERAGCFQLGTTSLRALQNAESPELFAQEWVQVCDVFDLILDCPKNVAVLRQTILQLAVQGRLVRQEPRDEPARVLVEKIQKDKVRMIQEGKIPKAKPIESTETINLNVTVPNNWILVRLGDISDKIHYGYTASADETKKKVRLIRITDIQNNRVIWNNVPGCEIDDSDYSSYAVDSGDLLIARTGGTIGKSYLVGEIPVPAVFASYLIRVVPNKNLDPKYVKLFADSPMYWNQLYEKCMGTGQPNVNGTSLRSLIVPLPPLMEQHRIVTCVDGLMALCDELEVRLKEMAGVQERFAEAAVKKITA